MPSAAFYVVLNTSQGVFDSHLPPHSSSPVISLFWRLRRISVLQVIESSHRMIRSRVGHRLLAQRTGHSSIFLSECARGRVNGFVEFTSRVTMRYSKDSPSTATGVGR